jgi:hypothetical protein
VLLGAGRWAPLPDASPLWLGHCSGVRPALLGCVIELSCMLEAVSALWLVRGMGWIWSLDCPAPWCQVACKFFFWVRAQPPGTRVVPGSCIRCDHGLCVGWAGFGVWIALPHGVKLNASFSFGSGLSPLVLVWCQAPALGVTTSRTRSLGWKPLNSRLPRS